jgi:uncharacterized protein (TIGR03083 family)
MQGDALEIGSRLELAAAEPVIADAFASQRRRLLELARTLGDDEWAHATRCSEWNAHELVVHVMGATDACRSTLTGPRSVFDEHFDPNSSPNAFVDSRSAQPVGVTLEQLDAAITSTIDAIEAQRTRTPTLQVTAVWGEPVDWRLLVTHMFFDGWVHERDLLLPLGREPEVSDVEARLATAYGLHLAGIVAGLFGIPLDVTLRLVGPGGGSYRIVVDHLDVRISVAPMEPVDGASNGQAVAVTDSLMGRDPELATVLDASPEVLEALSGVGAFLRA